MAYKTQSCIPKRCQDCEKQSYLWYDRDNLPTEKELTCSCGGPIQLGRIKGGSFVPFEPGETPEINSPYKLGKFREPVVGSWGEKMVEHHEFKNVGMF